MKKITNDNALYLCDGGACYCGAHLGCTAQHTGCDISGEEVHRVTPEDVRYMLDKYEMVLSCETCGREASLLQAV
jgi:hypothetical protein